MALFIAGTGTGVGKTVVTAGLADAFRRKGKSVCVYKPIQTGSPPEAPEDPMQIQSWLDSGIATACTYCFPEPVAPYVADKNRSIQPARLLDECQRLRASYSALLVEAAGGVRVPIAPQFDTLDLMKLFQLPALVVAGPFLGTINHTRLTVDALLHAGIEVKGVVISGMPEMSDPAVQSLQSTLENFLPVPLLDVIPEFPLFPASFQTPIIQRHFDQILATLEL